MHQNEKYILAVIESIKTAMPFRVQCYRFAKILNTIFLDSEIYYNGNHCITKIGDNFFDIDGLVSKDKAQKFDLLSNCGPRIEGTLEIAKRGYYDTQIMAYLNLILGKVTVDHETRFFER